MLYRAVPPRTTLPKQGRRAHDTGTCISGQGGRDLETRNRALNGTWSAFKVSRLAPYESVSAALPTP
jgi:hypothetical protein